ncbi:hypothetical protein CRYUN_Cryun06bG0173500 [Craigia yunnanensis]
MNDLYKSMQYECRITRHWRGSCYQDAQKKRNPGRGRMAGHLTVKADVYSFGVVLLEIFSGSVAVQKYTDGTMRDLTIRAKPHLSNQMELHNIIDKKIARNTVNL